jgi:redox-sensitive bicupin YhaK (pirin superfamily)
MSAGRGIVHSERTPSALRAAGSRLSGIQVWVALPLEAEEAAPAFTHHEGLPETQEAGVTCRLILGELLGLASPVATLSPMSYAELRLAPARRFVLPAQHEERGVYVVEGTLRIGDADFAAGELLVLEPGAEVPVASDAGSRFMFFGGPRLDAPRFLWWNFVSSRRERIEQAAAQWKAGGFEDVPGDTERIPLPEGGPKVVDYP